MIWDVSFTPPAGGAYEDAYQGTWRFYAWLVTRQLVARGFHVRVMVKPPGALAFRNYAFYEPS